MARYRKVDPRVWNDARFVSFSDGGKLVWLMLLTHPHMSGLGAMRATVPGLAAEMGWSAKAFEEAFSEPLAKGMVKYDAKASFLWVPKYLRYNAPESPNVVKSWAGQLEYLPECSLLCELIQTVREYIEGMPKAFREALPQVFAKSMANQEQEQEKNKNTTTQGSTVNEGRARARVDVPEGGDGLCPEHHEAEEVAGGRGLPEAPDVLDGTLDVSMEFLELRELYDRLARREAPLAGHGEYRMLRAGRMWPGLARITQAIEEWGETPRWKRGYAPGLKRFLTERWWLKSPDVDDLHGAASDAGREPDTYSRLLKEALKQKEVRA